MLLEQYEDYLKKSKVSEKTIKIYCGKLRKFLYNGYSEQDLTRSVDILISKHAKGGCDYDENDSGNTAAALGKLKDYIQEPYRRDFIIIYKKTYSSFPVNRYIYRIIQFQMALLPSTI